MIETAEQDQFVVDASGNKTAVLLNIKRYFELIEAKEELEEIRIFDAVKKESDEIVPFLQVVQEIEAKR